MKSPIPVPDTSGVCRLILSIGNIKLLVLKYDKRGSDDLLNLG